MPRVLRMQRPGSLLTIATMPLLRFLKYYHLYIHSSNLDVRTKAQQSSNIAPSLWSLLKAKATKLKKLPILSSFEEHHTFSYNKHVGFLPDRSLPIITTVIRILAFSKRNAASIKVVSSSCYISRPHCIRL